MKVTISDIEEFDAETDSALLLATIARLKWSQGGSIATATVYVSKRASNGWLEYIAAIERPGHPQFTLGCIQRTVGAKCEFHS